MAIGRGGLGLELGRAVSAGCLEITDLVVALPTVRFPLDVSGGVSRFRHRRGTLDRISVELPAQRLRKWAAPRLRGLIGTGSCEIWVGVEKSGAIIALSSGGVPTGDLEEPRTSILAFSVTAMAVGEDLSLVCGRARGTGLPGPPTAMAIFALQAILGDAARREGARFVLDRPASRIVRALLPEAGVRAPGTSDVRISSIAAAQDAWILHASAGALSAEPTEAATRALEAAGVTRAADDARIANDYERARALDLLSLERAPRHPEIAGRIAEIDAFVGGRAEAALATIAEAASRKGSTGAEHDPRERAAAHLDFLRGELFAETGDTKSAIAAFERAGEDEPAPVLSARAFERVAQLTRDPLEALGWLDRAIARAPAVPRLRWARIAKRLAVGRTQDARADVEHLEAQASGPKARYAVWWRAGAAWQRQGLVADAAPLFERALRFVPDDAQALAGLGRALLARGKTARGIALLTRAIDLREAAMLEAFDLHLDLARALADKMDDRPAAIAHVRNVAHGARETAEARALEGRWRAELGDIAGASLAYARLRDHAETLSAATHEAREPTAAFLLEAAIFERGVRDSLAAQRHLAAALRLCPTDPAILSAYRAVGAEIAGLPPGPPAALAPAALPSRAASFPFPPALDSAPRGFSPDDFANMEEHSMARLPPSPLSSMDLESVTDEAMARDEARVEELIRRLQADPSRDDVVDELVDRLLRLGRSHELFALLSARLEDANPERRKALLPKQREVLSRLEADARERGQELEAGLFASARSALE